MWVTCDSYGYYHSGNYNASLNIGTSFKACILTYSFYPIVSCFVDFNIFKNIMFLIISNMTLVVVWFWWVCFKLFTISLFRKQILIISKL